MANTLCVLDKQGYAYIQAHAAGQPHAHTHKYVKLIAFPRQNLFANAPLCLPCLPLRLYFFIERKGPFYPENGGSTFLSK
jgi:hypothetical protein